MGVVHFFRIFTPRKTNMFPWKIVVGSWKTIYLPIWSGPFFGDMSVSLWGAGSVSWKVDTIQHESWGTTIHMVVAQVQSTQRGHAHEARLTQKKPKEMCKASNYLWFAWNDTPVQQHLLMFFGWFCYDSWPFQAASVTLGHPPNGLQDSISSEAFGQLGSIWLTLYRFSASE